MLSPTAATWRLTLHVLAAAIWVGGQFVLGALVPTLRRVAPEATKVAARTFGRLAWPAFAVLVITGIWNLTEVNFADRSTAYQVTLFVKLVLVALSGVAAAIHQLGTSRAALAIGGAFAAIGSLSAMFFGILLLTGAS
ncbi:MAG: CopD family protein [Desertimonas sp.]